MTWSEPAEPGGTFVIYDTLVSPVASDYGDGTGECVADGEETDTTSTHVDTPGPGTVLNYLVRSRNVCTQGSGALGTDSEGNPRTALVCP